MNSLLGVVGSIAAIVAAVASLSLVMFGIVKYALNRLRPFQLSYWEDVLPYNKTKGGELLTKRRKTINVGSTGLILRVMPRKGTTCDLIRVRLKNRYLSLKWFWFPPKLTQWSNANYDVIHIEKVQDIEAKKCGITLRSCCGKCPLSAGCKFQHI